MNTVEVHNVYTLYELDEDGETATPSIMVCFRPQDWGNRERWHYHQCRIEFFLFDTTYINNCHLWQEVERNIVDAMQLIAPELFRCFMPGAIRQLAGKESLHEDDFWRSEWGEMPPYYDEDDNPLFADGE